MTDNFDKTRENIKENAAQQGLAQQFLTFTVEKEEYGVDIMTGNAVKSKGWTRTNDAAAQFR